LSDFRDDIKAQFLHIADLAREAANGAEVHHTWAKCLSEWRGALRDALAVHDSQQAERELEELRELRDELRDLRDSLHGGRAGYMEPPEGD
jgi:hypothetical protein